MRGGKQRNVQVAWHGAELAHPQKDAEADADPWVSFYCAVQLVRAARNEIETLEDEAALICSLDALARTSGATLNATRLGASFRIETYSVFLDIFDELATMLRRICRSIPCNQRSHHEACRASNAARASANAPMGFPEARRQPKLFGGDRGDCRRRSVDRPGQ